MDVAAWLRGLGFEEYEPAFRDNRVDAEVLPDLTEAHLASLGLPLGPRLKLLKAIAALREGAVEQPSEVRAPRAEAERRQLTVMFCDLVGSTALSARLDPEDLRAVIGAYHRCCAAVIERSGGFVAKYMGDGVLAFFGAPHEQPDQADRAVAAALGIDAFAQQFSAERKARGIDFGHSRIGVHTGIAMVGNIGSRSRLKYAAQGDTLNTGSRLEGLNKAIGTRISVSGETVRHTRRHRFRPVGAFVVKGRHGAIDIFEPLAAERYDPAMIARYDTAFGTLVAGEPGATAAFAALRRDYPDDPCIAFHCSRLAAGDTGALIVMAEK